MKFTSTYRGWKRDVWSPLVPNHDPLFDVEESQPLTQSSHHALSDLLQEMVGQVDHLEVMPLPLWP